MRIAILADAHGNQFGFFAALVDAKEKQPDLIVCAGDMLCCFPGGPQILSALLSENIPCVRGNSDDLMLEWLRSEPASPIRSSPQFLPLRKACARFQESDLEIVDQWPLTTLLEDATPKATVLLCHGTPESNTHSIADFSSAPVASHLKSVTANVVVAGHYHHQWSQEVNGTLLVLVGSCGMPCAGGTNAQYTILDIGKAGIQVSHQSVEYDHSDFIADLQARNYVEEAGPVGWLGLSQLLLARPLQLYYFRDQFEPARGEDLEYLSWSVKSHLEEYGALAVVEKAFGPLTV
jgi:putative phosphoesterase